MSLTYATSKCTGEMEGMLGHSFKDVVIVAFATNFDETIGTHKGHRSSRSLQVHGPEKLHETP